MLASHVARINWPFGLRTRRRFAAAAISLSIAIGTTTAWGSNSSPIPPPEAPIMSSDPIEADGTVNVPPFRLPPSPYLSPEARAALPRSPFDPEESLRAAVANGTAGQIRASITKMMAPKVRQLSERYPVTITDTTIAGLPAVLIRPVAPMPTGNAHKILINLPGGAFALATARGTGLLESIPLAAMAQVEVISITYRQSPEYKYPAANEDFVAVYRALLETYRAQDIAVFGCSSGGVLTAEAPGWLLKEKLPLPAAIGIFSAGADAHYWGDSEAFTRPFQALPPLDWKRPYFDGANLSDPLVSPIMSPELLRAFPPTLVITSTRAFDMSGAVNTHRELVKAGVDAELHVWDGLGHAFFYNSDLPEAKEAFEVMTRFFSGHLKLSQQ
jgi:monoterpene epsilon-lactone hydrolase